MSASTTAGPKRPQWLPLAVWAVLLLIAGGCRSLGGEAGGVEWRLVFEGNDSLGTGKLEDVIIDNLADFERSGYSRYALDDAAYAIESHYRSKGWPSASATYDLTEPEEGLLVATIRIQEGVRCELGEVRFEGATVFNDRELRELVVGEEQGLFGSASWFVQSEVETAREAIESRYLSAGYLLVEVRGPRVEFRSGGRIADVAYTVEEGVLFQVAELAIEGETPVPHEELIAGLPVAVGNPYSPRSDRRVQSAVVEALGAAGYPDATARVVRRADDETGAVTIAVRVEAGEYATVSEVRIEGNERTRDSLIRSRLVYEVGEPFTPERERETFRRLFTTGLFSSIRLDLEGEEGRPERTLVVRVKENPAREVFVEPGWGSYELARVRGGYRNNNLFGTGRGFRAETIASVRHLEAELGVNDPFLFGSEVFADLSTTVLRRIEPSFTRLSAGLDATLARQWTGSLETGLAYQYRRSAAEDVDVTDAAALAALDDVSISAVEVSARFDTRDNPLVPKGGSLARFSLQWGDRVLGSELDFVRARCQLAEFVPLHSRATLGLSFRTGGIVPTHDTVEIPLQERFFNGGENTVRSFRENELGPLDTQGEALGGEAFTVLSAELRRQLGGNLSGAAFVDAGNVARNWEDYLEFDDFRVGIGLGIRYMLPIGPLRVDAGWNPNPRPGEDRVVVHFSVGMPF